MISSMFQHFSINNYEHDFFIKVLIKSLTFVEDESIEKQYFRSFHLNPAIQKKVFNIIDFSR